LEQRHPRVLALAGRRTVPKARAFYEKVVIFLGCVFVVLHCEKAWTQDSRWIEDERTGWFLTLEQPTKDATGRLWLQLFSSGVALTVVKGTTYGPLTWSLGGGRLYFPFFRVGHPYYDYSGDMFSPDKSVVLELTPGHYFAEDYEERKPEAVKDCSLFRIRIPEPSDESKKEPTNDNNEEVSHKKKKEEARKRPPSWLTTDRQSKYPLFFIGRETLEQRFPLGITNDRQEAQGFVLSNGNCDSDVRRQGLLDEIEDSQHAAELANAVDFARDRFRKRIAKLTVVTFPFKDVNLDESTSRDQFYLVQELGTVLEETKQVLTQPLNPPWAAPLIKYIDLRMPDRRNVERKNFEKDSRLISKATGDQLVRSVEYVFQKLTTVAADIALNVSVISNPSPVDVTLRTRVGREIRGTSGSPIRHVYRGIYTVIIQKFRFKTITYDINFVESPGDTLNCQLVPEQSPEAWHPCDLK
jgi:hypothetical protein